MASVGSPRGGMGIQIRTGGGGPAGAGWRDRWAVGRARRRATLARYWQADGDLDEAARHGYRALRLVRERATAWPAVAAQIALTVADIDRDRAEYAASHDHLGWTVRLLERAAPGQDRDRLLARARIALGDAHRRAGRYEAAGTALAQARQLVKAGDPPEPVRLAAVLMLEGIVAKELGAFDRARHLYAEVGEIHDRFGASPAEAAALQHNRAGLAHAQGDYVRAERHARRAVALREKAPGPANVDLAEDLAVLAAAVAGQQRYDQARALFGRALDICRTARPPRDYEIAVHRHNLAAIEQSCGRFEDAERLYRQALADKERLLGAEHPEVGLVVNNLGTLLHDLHRDAEAADCYRRALTITENAYPPHHPTSDAIRHNLDRLTDPP